LKALILPLALALLGLGVGFGVRLLSVRLARIEELEPGRAGWQLAGPPVVTAALFFAFGYGTGWTAVDLVLRLLFAAVFVQVIFFDLEHRLILDWITYPALALALLVSSGLAADDFKSGPQKPSIKVRAFNPLHCSGSGIGGKSCLV